LHLKKLPNGDICLECAGMVGLDLNKLPDGIWLDGDYENVEEGDPLICTQAPLDSWHRIFTYNWNNYSNVCLVA
jgi:hypothetical protein